MNFKFSKDHIATYIFLAVSSIVFIYMYLTYGSNMTSSQALIDSGALFGGDILLHPSHIWRFVTAIFVHIGFAHFFTNMFTLYFLGRQIEEIMGSKRFFFFYLLAGIFANSFVFAFDTEVVSAGASTSLFGIFAGVTVLGFISGNAAFKEFSKGYLALIIFNLVSNLFDKNVSLYGHLGGIFGGTILAFAFPFPDYISQEKGHSGRLFLAWLVFLGLMLTFTILPFYRYNLL
jgi:Uncharacterized membrane protein (homolog of Drosophila rhomboid)